MVKIRFINGLFINGYLANRGGLHVVTYDSKEAHRLPSAEVAVAYLKMFDHPVGDVEFVDLEDEKCNGMVLTVREVRARINELEEVLERERDRLTRGIAQAERNFLVANMNAHHDL